MNCKKYLDYIDAVQSGKIVIGKTAALTIARHCQDLEKSREADYPYWFDDQSAMDVIEFIQLLKHVEGKWAGQLFELEPWQQFVTAHLFGWKRKADNLRRFRSAYISVGRKNGKSNWLGGIGLYLFAMDGEAGAQVYTAATKRKQAAIIHGISTRIVRADPELKKVIRVYKDNLHIISTGSKYEPLGADSDTEDGLNVHGALIDEYHAHKTDDMYNVLRSAMGARQQPLLVVITTAGFDRTFPCFAEQEYLRYILNGQIQDDAYTGIIYELDQGDDWRDPAVWVKSNPNLGISVSIDDMQDMCKKAIESPLKQNEFKTKKLNLWTEDVASWITADAWKAKCNDKFAESELTGRECYAAFDLSTIQDLTAWTLCFPPKVEGEKTKFIHRFYIPAENMVERERNDKVPYSFWTEKGYVTATPGNVIDYAWIEAQIKEDATRYNIKEIAYDPYNATDLVIRLQESGLNLVQFTQGFRGISPAAKDFEKRALAGEMSHNSNPVMSWMLECCIVIQDPNGNIKPVKPDRLKSRKRIDGVITSIMALDRALRQPGDTVSVYETRGIEVI